MEAVVSDILREPKAGARRAEADRAALSRRAWRRLRGARAAAVDHACAGAAAPRRDEHQPRRHAWSTHGRNADARRPPDRCGAAVDGSGDSETGADLAAACRRRCRCRIRSRSRGRRRSATAASKDPKGTATGRGAEAQVGTARVETGAKGQGFGLSSGGGGGDGVKLDVGEFLLSRIHHRHARIASQRNWNQQQQATGVVLMKYTILRSGQITGDRSREHRAAIRRSIWRLSARW